jgi:hypothetical protein
MSLFYEDKDVYVFPLVLNNHVLGKGDPHNHLVTHTKDVYHLIILKIYII